MDSQKSGVSEIQFFMGHQSDAVACDAYSLLNVLAGQPGIVRARGLSSSKNATPYAASELKISSERPCAVWCRVSKAGPGSCCQVIIGTNWYHYFFVGCCQQVINGWHTCFCVKSK